MDRPVLPSLDINGDLVLDIGAATGSSEAGLNTVTFVGVTSLSEDSFIF